jgi:methanogenic corrinoid protein MtbC1
MSDDTGGFLDPILSKTTQHNVRLEVATEFLTYARQAAQLDRPQLLTEYVAWRRVVDEKHDGLGQRFQREVETLLELRGSLPPDLRQLLDTNHCEIMQSASASVESAGPSEPSSEELLCLNDLPTRVLEQLLAGDRRAATALILAEVEQGLKIHELYLGVLQPVLTEIGRRWQVNALSVGQEHYCTAVIQSIMSQLYPKIFSAERNGWKMVATAVPGNLHEIGIRMVADVFELNGWDTYFLGQDCPLDSVLAHLEEFDADLLAISAALVPQIDEARNVIQAVKSRPELRHIPILVGGALFCSAPDLWRETGADGSAADAVSALALAEKLVTGNGA